MFNRNSLLIENGIQHHDHDHGHECCGGHDHGHAHTHAEECCGGGCGHTHEEIGRAHV